MSRFFYTINYLLISLSIFSGAVLPACGQTMLPIPGWMEAQQVSESMVINRLPSRVTFFTTKRSSGAVLNFYESHWQKSGSKQMDHKHFASWDIIAALHHRKLYTVQVAQTSDGANGYLAVADLKKAGRIKKSPTPAMRGSTILSDVASEDAGQKGRTVQLTNKFSVPANTTFYNTHFQGIGWHRELENTSVNGSVLAFASHNTTAHIVISGGTPTTSIIYQTVTRP